VVISLSTESRLRVGKSCSLWGFGVSVLLRG
jgi:hypothetical protein